MSRVSPSNKAVKLSVRAVTARARSARSAPARPASYGRRLTPRAGSELEMPSKSKGSDGKLKWYGVKSLFRTVATGKPVGTDRYFDPQMSYVEERVVLYQARTFREAIQKAEKDARKYARYVHINPYGQKVITRCLDAYDAYEIDEAPGVGCEVFSATEILKRRVSDKAIVKQYMGHKETQREFKSRRNILNREFSGMVRAGV